jgi:lipopolysaccharide biosynthesis glycosyltransferase
MTAKPIHVVLAMDDKYWAPAYALMRSVCLFTFRRTDLRFHIFTSGLKPDHLAVIEDLQREFGATQIFYDIPHDPHFAAIADKARQSGQFPNIVYGRILIAKILPPDIERLIYLDCDMLVRVPIERLAEMDMQGYPLAAVPDYAGAQIMTRKSLIDPRRIFDPAMRYFNSGLLLIDMHKWRELKVEDKFVEAIDSGLLAQIYYDQDFLNLTFRDNWLELDRFWNLLDPRPSHAALNPHVLHYTGERKPWLVRPKVAYARLYRHVMTNEIYYRYLIERSPAWQKPLIRLVERLNRQVGVQGHSPFPAGS